MGLARSLKGARGRSGTRAALWVSCILAAGIASGRPFECAHATPLLAGIGPDAWLERLQHEDPRVRRDAAWMLGRYASATAASRALSSTVTARLGDRLRRERDEGVQRAIVYGLSRYASADVDASLREAAGAESNLPVAVRAAALRALVSHAPDPQPLVPWLLRGSWAGVIGASGDLAQDAAVRALSELSHDVFARALAQSREASLGGVGALRAIGRRGDPRWARPLLEAITPGRPGRSLAKTLAALDAIARLRCVEAAEAVVAVATRGEDLAARRAAVRTLASLGGSFDVSALRSLVAEPSLREVAIEALGALGDRGSMAAIVAVLDAPWSGDRRVAAESLGALGDPEAIAPLVARARREPDVEARGAMWRAVARIGGARAARALAVDDPLARWALAELLLREGGEAGSVHRTEDPSGALVAALEGAAPAMSWPPDDADGRVSLALSMGHARGDDEARATSLDGALARESDEGVRSAIALALGRLAGDSGAALRAREVACDALLSLVERERGALSTAGAIALSQLGELRVEAARDIVAGLVASEPADPVARRVAIFAAGRLRVRGVRLPMERALAVDADDGVRGAAAFALAAVVGVEADGALASASAVASSDALLEQIAAARAASRADVTEAPRGVAVVRASSATPRSIWRVDRADGGLAFGVATADGEVWIEGGSSLDEATLETVR